MTPPWLTPCQLALRPGSHRDVLTCKQNMEYLQQWGTPWPGQLTQCPKDSWPHYDAVSWDFDVCLSSKRRQSMQWCHKARSCSLYWSIHTKDESKRGTAFAFIFDVNWLWRCGVTASFGVFFHEIKCNGVTSFMEFMITATVFINLSKILKYWGLDGTYDLKKLLGQFLSSTQLPQSLTPSQFCDAW